MRCATPTGRSEPLLRAAVSAMSVSSLGGCPTTVGVQQQSAAQSRVMRAQACAPPVGRLAWRYPCGARATHYALGAVLKSEGEVNQQICASYRILAQKMTEQMSWR